MLEKFNPFVRMAANVSSLNVNEARVVGRDHRLFYVNTGAASLDIGGKSYSVLSGTVVYIPAYTYYEFRFVPERETLLTVLNFDFDCERSEIKETIKTVPYERFKCENLHTGYTPQEFSSPFVISDGTRLGKYMQKIRRLLFDKEPYYRDLASAALKTLLLEAIVYSGGDAAGEAAMGIISYIKEHYAEKIEAKDLSARFGYHPNHINRLVKLNTGRGFKEFLIHYRLRVAKDLLSSTAESITVISENCGFSTPSYFAEIFSKYEGITPREYRNSLKSGV